jgi:TetR/AcrR family transcriptional repressor of mexJK operon
MYNILYGPFYRRIYEFNGNRIIFDLLNILVNRYNYGDMVLITHRGINTGKVREILDAAQERFGMYGYYKTTMQEIAEDLNMSKAFLYYYYPDKETLFRAVFEKEKQQFIDILHEKNETSQNPVELLKEYALMRIRYFSTLLNLSRVRVEEMRGVRNMMKDLWEHFRLREKEEIVSILTRGVRGKKFKIKNIDETSVLFLDALRGISINYLRNRDISFLNDEDLKILENQVKLFTDIFIKGIEN